METKIAYSPSVVDSLNNLIDILFHENYFSYIENAFDYVENIKNEIENNITTLKHHKSPIELSRYGKYYIRIKSTKRTSWYVFFNKKDNLYLIRYITNNHVSDAAFLKDL